MEDHEIDLCFRYMTLTEDELDEKRRMKRSRVLSDMCRSMKRAYRKFDKKKLVYSPVEQ
ncbi:hypothetical protein KIPB_013521, partial [Kipferlia bialata]|eukprot:g13521.t1